jgi:hypothetical protein
LRERGVSVRRIAALALLIMPAVPSADEVAADADILSRLADDSTRPRDERNEKLFVRLSRPDGATIRDRRATGKILDDD